MVKSLAFIESIYDGIDKRLINESNPSNIDKVELFSKVLNINVYYIPFSSELNNLMNQWNIFLNQNQSVERIWQDFGALLGMYYKFVINAETRKQMVLHKQQVNTNDTFAYYFCVPEFLLRSFPLPYNHAEAISLIAKKFAVEEEFAARRLKLCI